MANGNGKELSRPVRDFALAVETALQADMTIAEALVSLRKRTIEHKVIYFYVVSGDGKLLGVIPTRRLLLEDPSRRIQDVMAPNPIAVRDNATLEDAMELFAMHRLLALPVIDGEGRLMGHIDIDLYADEAVDLSERQRSAEVFQLIGVSLQQVRTKSAWSSFRLRMPWLLCNIFGGVACAAIAAYFHLVLAEVLLLAMFIPLVLTLSESISMQSMTITLEQMRVTRSPWLGLKRRASVEWKATAMVAIVCAGLVGLAATLWGKGLHPATVIGTSIMLSMAVSASIGAIMPAALHTFKLDPKVAAGPVVLMLADVITTLAYLSLATWMLL